jgi:hypothetical protein
MRAIIIAIVKKHKKLKINKTAIIDLKYFYKTYPVLYINSNYSKILLFNFNFKKIQSSLKVFFL